MMKHPIWLCLLTCTFITTACKDADPPVGGKSGQVAKTPDESIIYPFNGTNLDGWEFESGASKSKWQAANATITADSKGQIVLNNEGDKYLVNTAIGTNIYTTKKFGDCKIELEFLPAQGANSGLFIMGEYELQIETAAPNTPIENTDHGSLVQVKAPTVYAGKPIGEWQKYEIDFQAPRFDADGKKTQNAKFIKITLNGQVVHENVEVDDVSFGCLTGEEHPTGPLMLQGLEGAIVFKNIKITPKDK